MTIVTAENLYELVKSLPSRDIEGGYVEVSSINASMCIDFMERAHTFILAVNKALQWKGE